MAKKDSEIVSRVVEKVLADFDFEVDDVLESREEVAQAIQDGVLENVDEEPPAVDWIEIAEPDHAEEHRNERGDWLAS